MLMTKRRPVSVGEILLEEFMRPLGLTRAALAVAMGVNPKMVSDLCAYRRAITVDTALILARVFDTTAEFWLNLQQRNDLWQALNSPVRRQRIDQARPIQGHAA